MNKQKRIIRMILSGIGLVLSLILLSGAVFMAFHPTFGAAPKGQAVETIKNSPNFSNGKFRNYGNVGVDMSFGSMGSLIKAYRNQVPNTLPDESLPFQPITKAMLEQPYEGMRFFWLGHSSFIIQHNNKIYLIDPVFGDSPSPNSMVGPKRFSTEMPITPDDLPYIDGVFISHDHYDHLDYPTILKIACKTARFVTPLGVGAHLERWGVDPVKIEELDWWQSTQIDGIQLISAPAQHFSGRGKWFADRETTLWCSFILKTDAHTVFFSGDSGYGAHFKEIGEKYGPFDFAMLECGQYNPLWKEIHMMPEETAMAGKDVKTNLAMPIHWGAFKLALHSWTDPVERFTTAAKSMGLPYITPMIGEAIELPQPMPNHNLWWK